MTRPSGKTGILFLDVEGGWGGSSRSLHLLVEALDRDQFEPVVLHRKIGPVEERYDALGVPHYYAPELAAFRPAERKNPIAFGIFVMGLRKFPSLLRRVRALDEMHGIRLIHINHESLALTGFMLARALKVPCITHLRTFLVPGWFARQVYRVINRISAHVICIAEPVRDHFANLVGSRCDISKVSVIHNISPEPDRDMLPLPVFEEALKRFRILSLTNFSPNRGVDRVVDVAEELRRREEDRIAFYLFGRSANTRGLSGRATPYYGSIEKRVREHSLEDMVYLSGHTSEPARALVAGDVVIKLTRQANPWGRDIMEAMAAGLPVVTLGSYHGFIVPGENGFMDEEFDASVIADHLQRLADDPALCRKMRSANRAKAKKLFDGPTNAGQVEAIYRQVLSSANSRTGHVSLPETGTVLSGTGK